LEIHEHHHAVVQLSKERKAYIVSPTTLMATVMATRSVMQQAKINDAAHQIYMEMNKFSKNVQSLTEILTLAQKRLHNTDGNLAIALAAVSRFDSGLDKLHDLKASED